LWVGVAAVREVPLHQTVLIPTVNGGLRGRGANRARHLKRKHLCPVVCVALRVLTCACALFTGCHERYLLSGERGRKEADRLRPACELLVGSAKACGGAMFGFFRATVNPHALGVACFVLDGLPY